MSRLDILLAPERREEKGNEFGAVICLSPMTYVMK